MGKCTATIFIIETIWITLSIKFKFRLYENYTFTINTFLKKDGHSSIFWGAKATFIMIVYHRGSELSDLYGNPQLK
jgi:hypothetical protein